MYAVPEPLMSWPELVALAEHAETSSETLPHAAARDIARHRALLPAVAGSERRYASPSLRRFLTKGEVADGRLVPIADALFTGREVTGLPPEDGLVYRAFLAYLAKRTTSVSGVYTPSQVDGWSTLTIDS